jgi:hypothetical protein
MARHADLGTVREDLLDSLQVGRRQGVVLVKEEPITDLA